MKHQVARLSVSTLDMLANEVERGLIAAPFSSMTVGRVISGTELPAALQLLERLHADGISGRGLATSLRLAAAARRVGESRPAPSLVWSDLDLAHHRDTSVVCWHLFQEAEKYVLLSTYSLGHKALEGEAKGNPTLQPLAERMKERPELEVRLFVNVRRLAHMAYADDREVEDVFVAWFRKDIWPWERVPKVYYDPRSLNSSGEDSACLHAKCVVVDDTRALVTSANLTEAAQERNIEAGVLLEDALFAQALRRQFESLIDKGYVREFKRGLV